MISTRFMKLFIVIIPLGLIVLGFLGMQAMTASVNGEVCNYSSNNLWLTVTESARQKAYSLQPGHCTNVFQQDVEAIWGKDCIPNPCKYQAWKLSAGHFKVYNDVDSQSGEVLRIDGWGVESRWHIAPTWPRPDLSAVNYSLIR